jgi:hypothetical protein
MNTIEMQRSFLLKAHTLDITQLRDVSSYDIMFLLNQAQDEIIMEKYLSRKFDDLRPITTGEEVLAAAFETAYPSGIQGASVVDLKDLTNYNLYLRSQSKMWRSAAPPISVGSPIYVNNDPVNYENMLFHESNGTNRPIFKNPKEMVEGDFLIVFPDYYTTLVAVVVVFVRKPLQMTLDTPDSTTTNTCELPGFLHQDVVDKAVQLSMQVVDRNPSKRT